MNNLLQLVYTLGRNMHQEIPLRQLSKEAGIPYATTYRLVAQNPVLFLINKKGNIKLCSLNRKDRITKQYLILAERFQADLFKRKNPSFKTLVRELPRGEYCIILFGSRAAGTEREGRDVDLFIVNIYG